MKTLYILIFITLNLYGSLLTGRVVSDETNLPLANVTVTSDRGTYITKKDGSFKIHATKKRLQFKLIGYEKITRKYFKKRDVKLKPIKTKALYVSAAALKYKKKFKKILNIVDKSEVNALVIDVKNANGYLTFRGKNRLAKSIGAYKKATTISPKKLTRSLKKRGIYLIARFPLFKDNLLALKRPSLAIRRGKSIFRDRDKLRWANPYKKAVQKYNLSILKEVATYGFDEIQFDYVRFPVKSNLIYGHKNNLHERVKALQRFLKKAKYIVAPHSIFTSIDTFGVSCWSNSDSGIGHDVKKLKKYVDYISPMLYPSGFASGVPGLKNPLNNSKKVIYSSLKSSIKRHKIQPYRFKPWLQAFNDYAFDRRSFTKRDVKQQIEACNKIGTSGWLLWNASCNYDKYFRLKKYKRVENKKSLTQTQKKSRKKVHSKKKSS
jgi:hypothetical protein